MSGYMISSHINNCSRYSRPVIGDIAKRDDRCALRLSKDPLSSLSQETEE